MAFAIHQFIIDRTEVGPDQPFVVLLPKTADVIGFGYNEAGALVFWYKFEADPSEIERYDDEMLEQREFALLTTGTVSRRNFKYHATLLDDKRVLHLVENPRR